MTKSITIYTKDEKLVDDVKKMAHEEDVSITAFVKTLLKEKRKVWNEHKETSS